MFIYIYSIREVSGNQHVFKMPHPLQKQTANCPRSLHNARLHSFSAIQALLLLVLVPVVLVVLELLVVRLVLLVLVKVKLLVELLVTVELEDVTLVPSSRATCSRTVLRCHVRCIRIYCAQLVLQKPRTKVLSDAHTSKTPVKYSQILRLAFLHEMPKLMKAAVDRFKPQTHKGHNIR